MKQKKYYVWTSEISLLKHHSETFFFFFFLNCVVRILRGVLDWQFKFRSKKKYKQYDTLLYAKRSNVMRCILFLIGIAVQILLQNVDDTYSLN